MKKLLLYAAVIAALLHAPVHGTDVGKLKPVELIYADRTETGVILITDTGDRGAGKTVAEAMKDLKETTAGVIYLDTADYLIVGEETLLGELRQSLKPGLRICRTDHSIQCHKAAQFLEIHKPKMKLRDWSEGAPAEYLDYQEGRYRLKKHE